MLPPAGGLRCGPGEAPLSAHRKGLPVAPGWRWGVGWLKSWFPRVLSPYRSPRRLSCDGSILQMETLRLCGRRFQKPRSRCVGRGVARATAGWERAWGRALAGGGLLVEPLRWVWATSSVLRGGSEGGVPCPFSPRFRARQEGLEPFPSLPQGSHRLGGLLGAPGSEIGPCLCSSCFPSAAPARGRWEPGAARGHPGFLRPSGREIPACASAGTLCWAAFLWARPLVACLPPHPLPPHGPPWALAFSTSS